MQAQGVDTAGGRVAPGQPSGVALINVATRTGENSISVAAEANEHLCPATPMPRWPTRLLVR